MHTSIQFTALLNSFVLTEENNHLLCLNQTAYLGLVYTLITEGDWKELQEPYYLLKLGRLCTCFYEHCVLRCFSNIQGGHLFPFISLKHPCNCKKLLYIKVCVCVCSFDEAMQTLSSIAGRHTDDLFEVFVEMRGHLYLHAATLLLKLAQDRQQTWRAVTDLAALCYLLAYQVLAHQPANGLPRMN